MTKFLRLCPFSKPVILAAILAVPGLTAPLAAYAQTDDSGEEEKVLDTVSVSAKYFSGGADTVIDPDMRFDSEDIRALGASSIEELLEELGPAIASSRGRGGESTVILLNGVRIASFREIHRYPPEAIERLDVLPEEAALKYGYSANQRVVNIVLKDEFSALTAEFEAGGPTQGAGVETETELGYLKLQSGKRIAFDGELETNSGILEADRDLSSGDPSADDHLTPETQSLSLGTSYHRPLDNGVLMTLSADADITETDTALGLSELTFDLPADNTFNDTGADDFFIRRVGVPDALQRTQDSLDASVNASFARSIGNWFLTSTSTIEYSHSESLTDRAPDASAFADAIAGNDPSVSPLANLTPYLVYRQEEAERLGVGASTNLLINGTLGSLPAGDISSSLNLNIDHRDRSSTTRTDEGEISTDLDRQTASLQASFELPLIAEEQEIPGVRSLNANLSGNVSNYSDFGTLYRLDTTLTWEPFEQLRLLSSYTVEQGAPSMSALGDTYSETPLVEVFDYVTGESVFATEISGGNPVLQADERRVMKLSADFKPLEESELRFRAEYTDSQTDAPSGGFPGVTEAVQIAFPDRFVRDDSGRLISFDTRAINFLEDSRQDARFSLSWSKTIEPPPPPPPPPPPEGEAPSGDNAAPSAGRGGPPSGGGSRGRGRRGSENATRLWASVYLDWHISDERVLAEGFPTLDFLDGAASGQGGGKPEYELTGRFGYSYKGIGLRAYLNWQDESFIAGSGPESTLYFSDLLTTDLRAFYTVRADSFLAKKASWLEDIRFEIELDNLFDERQDVTNGLGETPSRFEADKIDPVGRAVFFGVRKQF